MIANNRKTWRNVTRNTSPRRPNKLSFVWTVRVIGELGGRDNARIGVEKRSQPSLNPRFMQTLVAAIRPPLYLARTRAPLFARSSRDHFGRTEIRSVAGYVVRVAIRFFGKKKKIKKKIPANLRLDEDGKNTL